MYFVFIDLLRDMASPENDNFEDVRFDIETTETMIQAISKMVTRMSKIKDPVARFSVITTLFSMIADMATSFLKIKLSKSIKGLNYNNNPPEERKKAIEDLISRKDKLEHDGDKLIEIVDKILDGLSEWIQNPIYSPDHPLGNNIMKDAKSDFTDRHSPA